MFKQMGRGDISQVEGRILAHQHNIHGGEIETLRLPETIVIALPAPHFKRPRGGEQSSVAQRELRRQ